MGKLEMLLALSQRPELLVLDEPTDGLDPVVRRDVLAALLDYVSQQNATVFISSSRRARWGSSKCCSPCRSDLSYSCSTSRPTGSIPWCGVTCSRRCSTTCRSRTRPSSSPALEGRDGEARNAARPVAAT